jgi:hemolysin activation/secretion protein
MRSATRWTPWQRAACASLLLHGAAAAALTPGGRESTDRPSARMPALPDFRPAPDKADQGFVLPPAPTSQTPGAAEPQGPRFRVEAFAFEGNTVFDGAELARIAAPYAERELSVAELEELRQRLSRHYYDHGYVNSGALIPPGALRGGTLRFKIIEGVLDEVRVEGQGRLRPGYIQNRLSGDDGEPLNIDRLRDRFQVLLTDPLIDTLRAKLLPGTAPGHSVLEVEAALARPYQLSVFGNNYRPPSIGGEAGGIGGWVRNLTGWGDTLDFTFQMGPGTTRYTGGFALPLGDYGTQAFFRFDEAYSKVIEAPLDRLNIRSRIHTLEGGLSQTLIHAPDRKLAVGVALASRQNDISLLGDPFSYVPGQSGGSTQASVTRLFLDYLERWDDQVLALRSTFSIGVNAFGATETRNPRFPDSDFFAWLGQAQFAWRLLDDGTQLVWRGDAQLSNDPLLPLERIAVGGVGTVRGYRENYLVTDEGFSTGLELRYPLYVGTSGMPNRLTVTPFMDYGGAWNHYGKAHYVHSVGLALNWRLGLMQADLCWGYKIIPPLVDPGNDLQDHGIQFQVKLDAF